MPSIQLPHPGKAHTEEEWLKMVQQHLKDQMSLDLGELKELWETAYSTLISMGDVFFDPDEFGDRCYGCYPQQRAHCPFRVDRCKAQPPEGYCKFWYGSNGCCRLITLARVEILAAMLATKAHYTF